MRLEVSFFSTFVCLFIYLFIYSFVLVPYFTGSLNFVFVNDFLSFDFSDFLGAATCNFVYRAEELGLETWKGRGSQFLRGDL